MCFWGSFTLNNNSEPRDEKRHEAMVVNLRCGMAGEEVEGGVTGKVTGKRDLRGEAKLR